ncbi:MAG TPA: hypothetical protein VK785_01145, partial [Opitutaceae bacterium]|nr:hypothetical protein [Opitutaceae bacterium]
MHLLYDKAQAWSGEAIGVAGFAGWVPRGLRSFSEVGSPSKNPAILHEDRKGTRSNDPSLYSKAHTLSHKEITLTAENTEKTPPNDFDFTQRPQRNAKRFQHAMHPFYNNAHAWSGKVSFAGWVPRGLRSFSEVGSPSKNPAI